MGPVIALVAIVIGVCLGIMAGAGWLIDRLNRRDEGKHRKTPEEVAAEITAERECDDRLRSYDYDPFDEDVVLPFTDPADDEEPWPGAAAERLAHTADLPAFTPDHAPEATIDELVAKARAELDELWEAACQKFGVLT